MSDEAIPLGQSSDLAPNQTWRDDEVRSPKPDEVLSAIFSDERRISCESLTFAVLAALTLAYVGSTHWHPSQSIGNAAVETVVERIVDVESGGHPNAKNKRSSATGAGQFLDETWLEMVRTYRRDLTDGRSDKEILELRQNPQLARSIMTHLLKQNAAMLNKRGLPVTPGTLYLTHFAGPAGAVAVLSVPDHADAASLMASADVTGRTTREKLVYANPFLKELTVGDLKNWANRKMGGH